MPTPSPTIVEQSIVTPTGETAPTTLPETTGGAAGDPGNAPETPLVVHMSIDKAPKVDEEAAVILELLAYQPAPGTTAEIELPRSARLVSGEPKWSGDLQAGVPLRIEIRVSFPQEGQFTLRGRALREVDAGMSWGDLEEIYLTVGRDTGYFGFGPEPEPSIEGGPVP